MGLGLWGLVQKIHHVDGWMRRFILQDVKTSFEIQYPLAPPKRFRKNRRFGSRDCVDFFFGRRRLKVDGGPRQTDRGSPFVRRSLKARHLIGLAVVAGADFLGRIRGGEDAIGWMIGLDWDCSRYEYSKAWSPNVCRVG